MASLVFDSPRELSGSLIFDNPGVAATGTTGGTTGPITDADYQAWLESDDAIPNVLVDAWALVDGVLTPFHWSTCGYTTEGTNSPTFYDSVISTGIPYTEALSITARATIAASDLEIDNTDGVREAWRNYIWMGQPIIARFGDVRWHASDYRRIYTGVSGGMSPKSDRLLALHLLDMTARLDFPMTEHKFGGTGPNQDLIYPLCFGECFNVSGLPTDPSTRETSWHDGPVEAIKEVRAYGLPVECTAQVDTGRSELLIDNQGAAITASVQGDKFGGVYRTTISAIVQRIVTGYGNPDSRYTADDIDAVSFAAFEAAHQQPVGLNVTDRTNLLVGCDMLANSLGAQLSPSREGKLRLIQIALPAAGAAIEVRPHHMVLGELRPVQHLEPIAAVKVAFCRNWTEQTGLQTALPDSSRQSFETKWLSDTAVDLVRQRDLKLEGDPQQRDTMLLRRVDARAEAERLLALWGPGRDIYEFTGLAPMMQLQLGQRIIVFYPLHGMEAGKEAQVMSLTPNWKDRRVIVRFLA